MRQLHDALRPRVVAAGVAVESRPFTPHLTLARVRDRDRRQARDAARRLDGLELPPAASWRVTRAVLMQSDLSGPRPRYAVVQQIACAPRV
jgi:2'-5' RNA ligase